MLPPAQSTCSAAALALVVAATLLAAAAAIPMSERVHCHVCGGEDRDHRDLFPGQPPPPECQPELGLPRECPPNHKGCLTTYNGSTLTRTCAERAYDPCGVANGVVYCYCSGRLCNAQTKEEMRQRRCGMMRRRGPEDDEDAIVEDTAGSGDGEMPDPIDDCLAVTTTTTTATTTARFGPASPAPALATTTSTAPGDDDLDLGDVSQDSIEITVEANANATAKTGSGSGSGDAHRTQSSVVCVLAALLAALRVWRAHLHAGH